MKQKNGNPISKYMAEIGSRGGKAGSKSDKVKAAKARWAKAQSK